MSDFEILSQRFIEETIEPEEAEELLRFLKEDPVKRRLLAQHFDLAEEIRQYAFSHPFSLREQKSMTPFPTLFVMSEAEKKLLAGLSQEEILAEYRQPVQEPTVQITARKSPPEPSFLIGFIAASLIALIIWSAYLSLFPPTNEQTLDVAEKPQTPAVLVDVANVQWKGVAPKLGEPLMPGYELAFESGTVELLFFNGVRSIIEGPTDLTLLSESKVFCNSGRWSVTVPPSGIGFEIQTPQGTVRDLGTQFFAAIYNKNFDVHVLKGTVEVQNGDGKKRVYRTNEAIGYKGGAIQTQLLEPKLFVTKTEMRKRSDDDLRRHPLPVMPKTAPILSVDFSQESLSGITTFSGKREDGAFHFTDAESRIRSKSLGKLSVFTVLLNIRVDRLNSVSNPVLMSEGSKQGGLVWSVSSDGSFRFGCRRSGSSWMVATPIIFTEELFGEWVQIGLTYDGKQGQMSVYLNGTVFCTAKISDRRAVDLTALDVGNWKLNAATSRIDGAVRSIVVYDRVLELYEIRAREPATVLPGRQSM